MPEVGAPVRPAPSLQHLGLIWFVPVMGLSGLTLAWALASAVLGETAGAVAQFMGGLAAAVFGVLLLLSAWRLLRWPNSLRRWRWLRSPASRRMGVTPALLVPVVGNVLVPLAGVRLGHADWAFVQAAAGAALWPVVLVLLVLRVRRLGLWPDRLRPSVFVLVAPPSVIGLDLMVWQAGLLPAVLCWVVALGFLGWALSQLPRCFDLPFGMPMWGLSFPLAAFASFSVRLAAAGVLPVWVSLIALALASVVIAALLRWTWWGLRSGDLLQPDPSPAVKLAVGLA